MEWCDHRRKFEASKLRSVGASCGDGCDTVCRVLVSGRGVRPEMILVVGPSAMAHPLQPSSTLPVKKRGTLQVGFVQRPQRSYMFLLYYSV
jgi:hypothetical protein